jgi:hypothetical protein
MFPGQLISQFSNIPWQLAPKISQSNTAKFKVRIRHEIENIKPQLLGTVTDNFECHVEQCIKMTGQYLLETIFKSKGI